MKWCPTCKHRGEFGKLLPPHGIGVEVGVRRSDFAELLLSNWSGKLCLVDPWDSKNDHFFEAVSPPWDDEADFNETRRKMMPFRGRVSMIRRTSEDAASMVWSPLDFVYIDADHRYEAVRKDLNLWWPKLRHGGILAGHDFVYHTIPEVTMAVCEFALEHGGLEVCVVPGTADNAGRDGGVASWYVRKN